MASPASYTDGSPGFGTTILTINSVPFIAENVRINRPLKDAKQYTEKGYPGQRRAVADFVTGTATIQIGSGTSGKPQFGQTFNYLTDDAFGNELFALDEVPYEAENDAGTLRKIPITFSKVYNGSVTTSS